MTRAVYRRSLTARPGFDSTPIHVRFVVDRVELEPVFFLSALQFSVVSIIPPVLHTHLHLQVDLNQKDEWAKLVELKKKNSSLGTRGSLDR